MLPTISLIEEAIRDGGLPLDPDVLSRLVLIPVALLAATIHSRRFHFWNMLFALFFICSYVVALFLKLN